MRILVAEDDVLFRQLLIQVLQPDHDLLLAEDGEKAWDILQADDRPNLAILDWVMPGKSGPQICRTARALPTLSSLYLILLTAKNSAADIVAGLGAGADDYITKPFDPEELRARVRVGERIVGLQTSLQGQKQMLMEALTRQKLLQDLLPICPHCGALRADPSYWNQVRAFLRANADEIPQQAACANCARKLVQASREITEAQLEATK